MSVAGPEFIDVDGAKIALRYRAGSKSPGVVWLGGYRSDMLGTKAVVLDEWAAETGLKKEGNPPAGIVLIAPAPDFTAVLVEPTLSDAQKNDLQEKGYFEEPSEYSPNPYVYTRALIEDGRKNLVLKGIIETGCPVHILQGMQDPDVPYKHALTLVEHLPVDDVTLTLVRDGDHRLSRPQDLDLLIRTVSGLAERIGEKS